MFSKCPHCGASILDDTEELCPSCDQPLKGEAKPKPKAAPKPAAKPKPAADASAAAKPAKAKAAAKSAAKPAPEDDDPFEIGGQAGRKALRVAPKPAKGRMHRVECPMCESPGFIPTSAAGSEVRCWNKECRLPLYTAPAIEKEPEPEPEQKKSLLVPIISAIVLLGGGGAGYYFFVNGGEKEKVIQPIDPSTIVVDDPDGKPDEPDTIVRRPDKPVEAPKELTATDIRDTALAALPRALNDPNNQAKVDSDRLAAEAYLLAGNDEQADKMLSSILGRNEFYRIRPLTIRGSIALDAGDKATALTSADDALKLSATLPPAGREALDWSTDLAILLVRLGRTTEAAELIQRNHDSGIRGEFSALLAGAYNSGTYDLADAAGATLIRNTPNPQWVAVTRGLVSAGDSEAALAWAKRGEGDVAADSLVAWAGTVEDIKIDELAAQADSPALAARLLAAAGLEAASAAKADATATEETEPSETPAAVTELLNAAVAKLPADTAEPMPVPDMADLADDRGRAKERLPRLAEVRSEALAYLKVAELQFQTGDKSAAWSTLKTGLERLRAAGPSPVKIAELVDAHENSRDSVVSQLKSTLGISSRREAFSAFNSYRRQVDAFARASENRFAIQERLAKAAIDGGAESELVAWIESSTEEPWWSSVTAGALSKSDDAAIAAKAKAAITGDLPEASEPWGRIVREAVAKDDAVGLARKLNQLRSEPQLQGLWAGVAASLFVREKNDTAIRDLVTYLKNASTRQNVVELAAAQATKRGHGPSLYQLLSKTESRLEPSELVAMARGISAGAVGQTTALGDESASETAKAE